MGNRYVVKRENITPTAGQDILTIITPSSRRARVVQVTIGGLGSTSAAQQALIGRSTAGTTGGGAITPDKFDHSEQPAAASVVDTTWSVQPTIGTNTTALGWNALGGAIVWNAPKGTGYEARNAENISLRALASGVTYQACSVSVVFEED